MASLVRPRWLKCTILWCSRPIRRAKWPNTMFAAHRLRRATIQRRELYEDTDTFLHEAMKRQNRNGLYRYPRLREWCVALAAQYTNGPDEADGAAAKLPHVEWPIGKKCGVPIPPMMLKKFWLDTKWEEPERRPITILRRRFDNIASARREALDYSAEIGICEQHIREYDHQSTPPATAEV